MHDKRAAHAHVRQHTPPPSPPPGAQFSDLRRQKLAQMLSEEKPARKHETLKDMVRERRGNMQ